MRKVLHDNGLTIALLVLFAVSFAGQSFTGHAKYNEDQHDHGRPGISYGQYIRTAAFIESVFENWESEFLQMALYVWLTSILYQRGSAESKDPDDSGPAANTPGQRRSRTRGLARKIYENSLASALFLLFVFSFTLHLIGSAGESCRQESMHGGTCSTVVQHLGSATFWFESFQNWQSEFLSIAVLIVLSIFLRQKGSPESKAVDASHSTTGK